MTYSDNGLIYIPMITAVKILPPHLYRLQCNSHHNIIITTKSLGSSPDHSSSKQRGWLTRLFLFCDYALYTSVKICVIIFM